MKTNLKKTLMTAMTVGVCAGLISFSVCYRAHDMKCHGTESLEIRLEMPRDQRSSFRNITPASETRGVLVAYDGGGTYGG